MINKKSIWLLKSEKSGAAGEPDPYRAAFTSAGWDCTFVPVLSFNLVHQDKLEEAMKEINNYSGLILTSQRAAAALEAILMKQRPSTPSSFPVFVVGEATAAAAHKALDGFPIEVIAGGDCASDLAAEIVRRHSIVAFQRPLLFLSGNIRRDDLPNALHQAAVPFSELCVYETKSQATADDKKRDLNSFGDEKVAMSLSSMPAWVAFFSPSGVDSFLQLHPYTNVETCIWKHIRLAAIGKTTAADMGARGSWMTPHVVAGAPNAPSLLESITSYVNKESSNDHAS